MTQPNKYIHKDLWRIAERIWEDKDIYTITNDVCKAFWEKWWCFNVWEITKLGFQPVEEEKTETDWINDVYDELDIYNYQIEGANMIKECVVSSYKFREAIEKYL